MHFLPAAIGRPKRRAFQEHLSDRSPEMEKLKSDKNDKRLQSARISRMQYGRMPEEKTTILHIVNCICM